MNLGNGQYIRTSVFWGTEKRPVKTEKFGWEDPVVFEQKIQTETYWRQEFTITKREIEGLITLFLEDQRPLPLQELARLLVLNYCQEEKNLIRRRLSGGTVYRPNATFSVGTQLVFPHLNFAQGKVVSEREGRNPEYGDFQVITVHIDDQEHQFAAGLNVDHKLAFSDQASVEEMFIPSAEKLYEQYGDVVMEKLGAKLQQSDQFVDFRGKWLPVELLAEVHVGHCNIAEAVLDIKSRPLTTAELLPDLELPTEIPEAARIFSLNHALSQDKRFEDVGDQDRVVWCLQRWLPEQVVSPSGRLDCAPVKYDRTGLDVTHLQLEREIDDLASELMASPSVVNAKDLTLILGVLHRLLGVLPLTDRTRSFFPQGHMEQRTQVTFVDRVNNTEFPGWIIREHHFVYGLGEWYEENGIPAGAYIKLQKTEDPSRVMVDIVPRRMRREWVRVANQDQDGELDFQMLKRPIACEYDEFLLLEADESVAGALWQKEQERDRSLGEIIQSVFLALAKLSPHGTVHAKTLYSAVNLLYRCPPGRIFSKLIELPHFVAVENGYWMFNENIF